MEGRGTLISKELLLCGCYLVHHGDPSVWVLGRHPQRYFIPPMTLWNSSDFSDFYLHIMLVSLRGFLRGGDTPHTEKWFRNSKVLYTLSGPSQQLVDTVFSFLVGDLSSKNIPQLCHPSDESQLIRQLNDWHHLWLSDWRWCGFTQLQTCQNLIY